MYIHEVPEDKPVRYVSTFMNFNKMQKYMAYLLSLIHISYHSFNGYIRVLREAAIKPEVKAIKTTLYRLAKDSKAVMSAFTTFESFARR